MARGSTLNLAGAVCSQLSLLAVTVFLARVLGRDDVGRYAQCYALLVLVGLLALSGFRAGLTRFVVMHLADRDPGALRGTVRLGLMLPLLSSVVLGVAMFAGAPLLAGAFQDDGLVTGFRLIALSLPATTFTDAALAATQGWRTMRPYALVGSVLEPVTRLVLTVSLVTSGAGLTGALVALLISSWLAAVVSGVWLLQYLRAATRGSVPSYRPKELFAFSGVSWVASLASNGLIWTSTLLLGLFASSGSVGVYSVSTRLVSLAVFVMPPINGAFSPRIAHLYHSGRRSELAVTYGVATSWIVRLSLPAFVILILFPGELLAVFGREFQVGAAVTMLLAVGKLVDAATGPCALMLNMSGRPALNMIDNIGALLLNIGLNLWLIPAHGIIGAAVAWGVSLAAVNVTRLVQVKMVLGMMPFDRGVLNGTIAGMTAALAAAGVGAFVDANLRLVVGLATVVAVYVTTLVMLGPTHEDRLLLGMVRPRRGSPRTPADQRS